MPGRKKILQTLKTIFQQKEFEESPLPLPLPLPLPRLPPTSTISRKSSSSKATTPRKLPHPPPKLSIKMYTLGAYTAHPQKLEDLKATITKKKVTTKKPCK